LDYLIFIIPQGFKGKAPKGRRVGSKRFFKTAGKWGESFREAKPQWVGRKSQRCCPYSDMGAIMGTL